MKLKVTKDFYDKYTKELYKEGQVLEVSEERGKEILSSPYHVAKLVKEKKTNIEE